MTFYHHNGLIGSLPLRLSTDKKVKKSVKIKNQVPHLTQDTIWESDKNTRIHYTQESQDVSPFPASAHKAARNRQGSIIKTRNIF